MVSSVLAEQGRDFGCGHQGKKGEQCPRAYFRIRDGPDCCQATVQGIAP